MGCALEFTFIISQDLPVRYGTVEGLGPRQEGDQ